MHYILVIAYGTQSRTALFLPLRLHQRLLVDLEITIEHERQSYCLKETTELHLKFFSSEQNYKILKRVIFIISAYFENRRQNVISLEALNRHLSI